MLPPAFADVRRAQATPVGVFLDHEDELLEAAARQARCARALMGRGPWPAPCPYNDLFVEAHFHAVMAAECLLKHIYCLLRFSGIFNPRLARNYGHDVKRLALDLRARYPDFSSYLPLQDLITLIPVGTAWNENRYGRDLLPNRAQRGGVRQILMRLRELRREVLGEPHA